MDANSEYLSLTDLMAYASVSKNTLKKWMDYGMPFYRIGRSIRVRKSEFDKWMQQFRCGTSESGLDEVWDQVMAEV
jgi:excisionase family DNA binding protein